MYCTDVQFSREKRPFELFDNVTLSICKNHEVHGTTSDSKPCVGSESGLHNMQAEI